MRTIREAINDRLLNPTCPSIMSMVIDIMDQGHSRIPSKGTQGTFNNPLGLMVTGVRVHGWNFYVFPTLGTVTKGANLTIQIISTMLVKWKRAHGSLFILM